MATVVPAPRGGCKPCVSLHLMPTVSPDRPNAKDAVILDGSPLTIKQVAAVARNRQPVRISPEARNSMAGARAALERRMAEGEAL